MKMNSDPNMRGIYSAMEQSVDMQECMDRHGVNAAPYLTITTDEQADVVARHLAPRIAGSTVIEIGCGIGLLAMHLGLRAHRVYCIEANPIWTNMFVSLLLRKKPKNVSFMFGAADEFAGVIRGDVALFCTHSDVAGMRFIASQFAPVVIDVYGEVIDSNPGRFSPFWKVLRSEA